MQVVHGYKPPRLAARRSSTAVTSGPPGPDTVASSIAGPARSISIHNMVPKWATRPSVRGAECRAAVRLKVMQMAVDVASFTPAEADQLRRAMGAKRSSAKMRALMARFFTGCAANGLDRELATRVFEQIHAFSGYGFPVHSPTRHLSEAGVDDTVGGLDQAVHSGCAASISGLIWRMRVT